MGEAKRKALNAAGSAASGRAGGPPVASGGRLDLLQARFRRLGIVPDEVGFYDSPAFMAAERTDPRLLEAYAEWVVLRPRTDEYEAHVRRTVPAVAGIVARRFAEEGLMGACLNTSAALSRMLERLGVWSCVLRGSANVTQIARPGLGTRYWWDIDEVDNPGGITGHAWVCAPPYLVVDIALKAQPWGDDASFGDALPAAILVERAERISPTSEDVVCHAVREMHAAANRRRDPGLHNRLVPHLPWFTENIGAWQADVGGARLRYVPNATTASDVPLEQLNAGGRVRPIDIWKRDVLPAIRGVAEA